ncbi:MAG: T9SS type A sorting domain-containing protein, partial [Bacteroidales bacterium]
SLGSHFGYGYVVGECQPMEVQVQYCEGATEARLEAPDGIVSYVWRGPNGGVVGNTQKLSIQNPSLGLRYSVTMQSATGCILVLEATIQKSTINPDFTCDARSHVCYPSEVTLTSHATVDGMKVETFDWTISKISGVPQTEYYGTDSTFTYIFKDSGYYKILFTVYNESGCSDTSSVIVYAHPPIDVKINAPSLICKNTETEITASGADTYEWIGVKRVQSDSSAIVDKGGVYMVKGTNVLGCAFDTVEIADLEFAIHYTKEDNRCMVDTNGTISITQVVGDYVYPVHHYWEDLGFMNGASLSVREHLPTDTFVVYSIDAIGCFRYDTIPIKEELFLGNIGLIQGESFVQQTGNYTYTVDSVEGAEGYRWWAKALTSNGDVRLLDTRTPYNRILVSIRDANSIQLHVVAFNACDTSDTSSLFIQNASRISERTASDDLILFPNPTSDQLTIQCNKAVMEEITVVDLVGKVVLKQSIRAKECILDLRPLHKGLYFIRIQCDDALLTEKIIKK